MTDQEKNTKQANQIYLIINALNIAFMVYMFARIFRIVDIRHLERNNMNWIIVLVFILLLNILKNYAKKNGGIGNPMQLNKKSKVLHWVAIGIFLFGILGMAFLRLGPTFLYISLVAIPIDIIAIYFAHSGFNLTEETDLIDDFEIDED